MTSQNASPSWNQKAVTLSPLPETPSYPFNMPDELASDKQLKASDRFKNKLQEHKNFGDALIEVFDDLVKLEIVTWVAATTTDINGEEPTNRAGNRLKTTINLVDGDIENEIGSEFLEGRSYFELRKFHDEQCSKGAKTIADNLNFLADMGKKATDYFWDSKKEPSS